ncbi:hypothetical protein [Thalassoglobus sp.]|uniref:hypothetical protein n=1 Tax=Thalassoglobus sp. TaxID=2795869 RepID=UPI003AA83A27
MSRTITKKFTETNGRCGQRRMEECDEDPRPVPEGRLPRITKLMALAIRFEKLIRDGVVENQAEIAQLGMISRARVTQIMNLLNLAPEIQEEILFLPRVEKGKDPVTLKGVLPVAAEVSWERQLLIWKS